MPRSADADAAFQPDVMDQLSAVLPWSPVGVDVCRWGEPGLSGDRVEVDQPLGSLWGVGVWFDEPVMIRAEQDGVVQGGVAAGPPGPDVVCFTGCWDSGAAGEGAALVAEHHAPMFPLVLVDEAFFSAGRLPRGKLRRLLGTVASPAAGAR